MKDHVRVLVCGDEGVGKTTLISTFVSQHFPDGKVPPRMSEIRVPSEESDDGVHTTIWDSGSTSERSASLGEELTYRMQHADAIMVMYDCDRKETLDRLGKYWLPLIQRETKCVPVALVGKAETEKEDPAHELAIKTLKDQFKFVECVLRCTGKEVKQVTRAFRTVHFMALHPLAPLLDAEAGELTPACKRALSRIFRVYDKDQDGAWSDSELKGFQYSWFKNPLKEEDIEKLKKLIGQGGGLVNNKVVPLGLCKIFKLFMDRGRQGLLWDVLRGSEYDDSLALQVDEWLAKCHSSLPRPGGGGHKSSYQLSTQAEVFLSKTFDLYATDGVLLLSGEAELYSVMEPPTVAPWHPDAKEHTYKKGSTAGSSRDHQHLPYIDTKFNVGSGGVEQQGLTKSQFLCNWQLVTVLQPRTTVRYLFWLGFYDVDYSDPYAAALIPRQKLSDAKTVTGTRIVHAVSLGSVDSSEGVVSSAIEVEDDTGLAPGGTIIVINTHIPEDHHDLVIDTQAGTGSRRSSSASRRFDVCVVRFDPFDLESSKKAIETSNQLPPTLPRLLIGVSSTEQRKDSAVAVEAVISEAQTDVRESHWALVAEYCQRRVLLGQPLKLSSEGQISAWQPPVLLPIQSALTLVHQSDTPSHTATTSTSTSHTATSTSTSEEALSLHIVRVLSSPESARALVPRSPRLSGLHMSLTSIGVVTCVCVAAGGIGALWWWRSQSGSRAKRQPAAKQSAGSNTSTTYGSSTEYKIPSSRSILAYSARSQDTLYKSGSGIQFSLLSSTVPLLRFLLLSMS